MDKKIVLFFDELPWMATDKSGMISALEYFWNRHWVNDGRIKLIVCGSSASWIIKKLIKSKGGLHNRLTQKIRLMPFDLSETYQYLKFMKYECDYKQTLKFYMSMGGVPFYLKRLNKNNSIDQNIDHLFFNPDGVFFDEFDEVFSSLFDSSDQYKEIVELISAHKDGVPRSVLDVENKLTGSGGRLTKRLEDLEAAGFITSYLPFGRKKMGIYYRINDEYCYFYLKWIAPIKSRLKQDKTKEFWKRILNTTEYHSWQGYVFENICFKHTSQVKKTLCIGETALSSPWRYVPKKGSQENGAQIDLLFDRDDNAITLCEIKHTEQSFSIDKDYAEKLKQKISVFKDKTATKKQVFLSFISASGLKKNAYFDSLVNGVVRLEDLFL